MNETLIGYARCSTDEQDLTAQRQALHTLGGQIYDPDDPMGELFSVSRPTVYRTISRTTS